MRLVLILRALVLHALPVLMPITESQLQGALLLAAPKHLPDLRLFRRNVGVVAVGPRRIRFGIAGQCDLWGVTRGGVHVELELKTSTGRLSEDQVRWSEWCHGWGVTWMLLQAWKGETIQQTIDRWVYEIGEQL